MARILVAMSGGVDSSMAAALMVEQGHDVTGVHLKMADTPSGLPGKGCCTLDDARDARRVADVLGIPYYVWDFSEEFRERVVDDFVAAYGAGSTPNPCLRCNERVKYAALLQQAVASGFDALATGHHARVVTGADGTVGLRRAADLAKDQSYVLYMASQAQLRRTRLPVGTYQKTHLREMAAERGLVTASKPDSYDVCFIPDGDTAAFLATRLGRRRGEIRDHDGTVLAAHDGAYAFTIGQRRGLGLAGLAEPRYVTGIAGEVVTVGPRAGLGVTELFADDVTWTHQPPDAAMDDLTAQIRAHGAAMPCAVDLAGDTMRVRFTTRRLPEGVAPGQAVVLYQGDRCLGGGTIRATTTNGQR